MSRTKTKDAQLVVRMDTELIEQLDAYAEGLREEQPGPAWTRADVVRLLLTRALATATTRAKSRR